MRLAAWFAALLFVTVVDSGHAQFPSWVPEIRGYFLNVPIGSAEGPYNDASVSDFQRIRLMSRPSYGHFTFDVAYEHLVSLRTDAVAGSLGGVVFASGTDWLRLQGTIVEEEHVLWRHRVDRLSVRYTRDQFQASVGRQPVSWATTLFLTPADPFSPFDPADPFREYRAGVDAARVRAFSGQFTEFDGVVRVSGTTDGHAVTAMGRAKTAIGSWELSGWGGLWLEEPAMSVAATVAIAGGVLRGEAVVIRSDDDAVVRATIGVDRSFVVAGRNLYLVVEYQRDGFGAASSEEFIGVLTSDAAQNGLMQVFGRDEVVLQGSLQLTPLVSADALVIWNLNDPSALFVPGISYSAGNEVAVRGGVYLGAGAEMSEDGLPASEFGITPTTAYVAVTWFF
jgi:hypothetical protein